MFLCKRASENVEPYEIMSVFVWTKLSTTIQAHGFTLDVDIAPTHQSAWFPRRIYDIRSLLSRRVCVSVL